VNPVFIASVNNYKTSSTSRKAGKQLSISDYRKEECLNKR
jgi:hypothetical protein